MGAEYKRFEAYLKQSIFPASSELVFEEISEGNINHIYRATDLSSKRSVILKHAERVSRISPDIQLCEDRGRREAAYFNYFASVVPDALPQLFAYDDALHLIVMQDMKDAPVLRKLMLAGKPVDALGQKLGAFAAETTAATTDFCLPHEKKQMQQAFFNPELCALTEDLVFTAPFVGAKDNSVCAENETYLETQIYQNTALRTQAAALKFRFMNAPQALIHGDLHFGSVFIADGNPVIFDPEFCFFGPIGFDLGNLLAHFLMERIFAALCFEPQNGEFSAWLKRETQELLQTFETRLLSVLQKTCHDPVLKNEQFLKTFVASVFSDTAGYAGAECLRRTIGIAKIPEFDRLPHEKRVQMEKEIMKTGVLLMEHRNETDSAESLVQYTDKILIID